MYEDFIRNRITELRQQKNVSEYKMSLDLGRSKGYIQGISSGRALPSMSEFLYILEYLQVTPKTFFTEDIQLPVWYDKLNSTLNSLNQEDINLILTLAEKLKND